MKGVAKEHTCMTHGHRPQCGVARGKGRARLGWRWAKVGGKEDIYNTVNKNQV